MKTLIRLFILSLAVTAAWLIREQLIESAPHRVEKTHWVKLLDEPPPPKVESPPEPEPLPEEPAQELEQERIEQPEETQQASDDQLGVDEEGRAGADSFGLRGKKGGKDFLQARPSGQSGLHFLAYGGKVTDALERHLMSDPKLRGKNFVSVVKIWITQSGNIARCEIDRSSGNREIDERLVQQVSLFSGNFSAPPQGMPQPLKIRIRS